MELLHPNFNLDRTKNITPEKNKKLVIQPDFRGNKADLSKELGDYIIKSLKSDSNFLKDTLNSPKKRETFFKTLGTVIVATAASITNILTSSDKSGVKDEKEQLMSTTTKKEETKNKHLVQKNTDEIKFKTPRGKKSQIEIEYINFVNDNFANDNITSNKLKLLFNEYCGFNRNNKHVFGDQSVENKTAIKSAFEEIKEVSNDAEKINNIVSKYLEATPISDNIKLAPAKIQQENTPCEPEAKITSNTEIDKEKELKKQLDDIKTVFCNADLDLAKKTISKATKILAKLVPENIAQAKQIFEEMDTNEEKRFFISDIANKIVSSRAIKTYTDQHMDQKINFRQYNELVRAGIDDSNIKKIVEYLVLQYAKNIEITDEYNDFKAQIINDYPINNKFKKIMNLFSFIKSQEITLTSNDKLESDKDDLINELKKDFYRNNGHTSYKNLVAYLYGNRHHINNVSDFEKNQYENRFKYLLNVINNDKIFNNTLFSNHSKFRFVERFVLSENFGNKKFECATKEKVKSFIEELKRELSKGITVNSYFADEDKEKIGAQIRFNNSEFGNMVITLNSQGKMHTII